MKTRMENLRVLLVAVRNSLNIGAVARAMSNFGATQLRVVNPYEVAWRETKSAVGAEYLLARAEECATVAEAVADCSLVIGTTAVGNRELRQPLWSLPAAGPVIRERLEKSNVALLFGSEKWGLSNESLSYCHWLLRIPTREGHRSMNLGQAAAVCLYELGRSDGQSATDAETEKGLKNEERTKRREREGVPAKMETVERIAQVWLRTLEKSGYVAPRGKATAEEKLRRMLRRFELEESDAEVFLGMARKVLWKIEEEPRK